MKINTLGLNSLWGINPNYKVNNCRKVGFENKIDTFERNVIASSEFSSNVSQEAQKQILNGINSIVQNESIIKPLGIGATGVVYKMHDIDSLHPSSIVAKFSHKDDINPETKERQKVGYDFNDETFILKKVKSLGESSQQYVGKVHLVDGRNILLTTFVSGKQPDYKENPITETQVKSALNSLVELDEACVLHRDLKKENLLLSGDTVKIIDYGESIEFNPDDVKRNNDELNFISFEQPTNLQNFEDTFLSPYLVDIMHKSKKEAKDFYKGYLQIKSDSYYGKKARILEEKIQNASGENKEQLIENLHYQKTMEKVLREPTDEVIELELLRNQITHLSELAYKNEIITLNPLANLTLKYASVMTAKKLEVKANDYFKSDNNDDMKEYLNYQKDFAKYRLGKITGWTCGLVNWFLDCMGTDCDKQNQSQKDMTKQCIKGTNGEFTIPYISQISEG